MNARKLITIPAILLTILIIFLLGYTGMLDYQSDRREECASHKMDYNPDKDACE